MNDVDPRSRRHDHSFGQARKKPGETRTSVVILISTATMILEIVAGLAFGSMALLADGLHMASHVCALSIAVFAYVYARRHAYDARFSFGTGKVNSLAGFSGAILLAGFAMMMVWESVARLVQPVRIAFDRALVVAVAGLLVNGICAAILARAHAGHEDHEHHPAGPRQGHHDHNLRSAYLHVLADAFTSLLAIFALLGGKYFALARMDPLMGVVGALLVARWSLGLLRTSGSVLLDRQGPGRIEESVRRAIEAVEDTQVADFHLWAVGPGIYAAVLTVVSGTLASPDDCKRLIAEEPAIVHLTVELHRSTPVR
jgi:cation diffusion facilitator family transporter